MTDILDLIDNALADYELSGDAMRWTPDPPKVRPPISPEQARAALESLGRAFVPAAEQFKVVFAVVFAAIGRAVAEWAEQAKPLLASIQRFNAEVEAARRVRLRRMHSAYHHRKM